MSGEVLKEVLPPTPPFYWYKGRAIIKEGSSSWDFEKQKLILRSFTSFLKQFAEVTGALHLKVYPCSYIEGENDKKQKTRYRIDFYVGYPLTSEGVSPFIEDFKDFLKFTFEKDIEMGTFEFDLIEKDEDRLILIPKLSLWGTPVDISFNGEERVSYFNLFSNVLKRLERDKEDRRVFNSKKETLKEDFLSLIGATQGSNFVLFSKEKRKWAPLGEESIKNPIFTHISFAPVKDLKNPYASSKNLDYTNSYIFYALDIDFYDSTGALLVESKYIALAKLLAFLRDGSFLETLFPEYLRGRTQQLYTHLNFHPTLIIPTNKGYHLIWLLNKPLNLPEDAVLTFQSLLDDITYAIKERFHFVDKGLHKSYIRLPLPDEGFTAYPNLIPTGFVEDLIRHGVTTNEVPLKVEENYETYNSLRRCLDRCALYKFLKEKSAEHNYHAWSAYTIFMRNLYVVAPAEMKEKVLKEFLEVSSKYPNYKEADAIYHFKSFAKAGFVPVSCETLWEWSAGLFGGDINKVKDFCGLNCGVFPAPSLVDNRSVIHFVRRFSLFDIIKGGRGSEFRFKGALELETTRDTLTLFVRWVVDPSRDYEAFEVFSWVETRGKAELKVFNLPIKFFRIKTLISYKPTEGNTTLKAIVVARDIHDNLVEFTIPEPVDAGSREEVLKTLIKYKVIPRGASKSSKREKGKYELTLDLINFLFGVHRKITPHTPDNPHPHYVDYDIYIGKTGFYDPFRNKFNVLPWEALKLLIEEKMLPEFVYHRAGDKDTYFKAFALASNVDPLLIPVASTTLVMRHHYPLKGIDTTLPGNPSFLLVGGIGSGKTLRARAVMSLWGRGHTTPEARLYRLSPTSMTEPYFAYIMSRMHVPVCFDNPSMKGSEKPLGRFIIESFNAKEYPTRQVAHRSYKSYPFKTIYLYTMEPDDYSEIVNDIEAEKGTKRRIITFNIPDENIQREKFNTPFDAITVALSRFINLTNHHYGHVNVYYEWFRSNFNVEVYNVIKEELRNYKIEYTKYLVLSFYLLHRYYFSKFLMNYGANVKIVTENGLIPFEASSNKLRDTIKALIEELRFFGEELVKPTEELEKGNKILYNLLANVRNAFSYRALINLSKQPTGRRNFKGYLPHGDDTDKKLFYLLFGRHVSKGLKKEPEIEFNIYYAPFHLLYKEVAPKVVNGELNDYFYLAIKDLIRVCVDFFLEHPYYEDLRERLAGEIDNAGTKVGRLDPLSSDQRKVQKTLMVIFKYYILALYNRVPIHVDYLREALSKIVFHELEREKKKEENYKPPLWYSFVEPYIDYITTELYFEIVDFCMSLAKANQVENIEKVEKAFNLLEQPAPSSANKKENIQEEEERIEEIRESLFDFDKKPTSEKQHEEFEVKPFSSDFDLDDVEESYDEKVKANLIQEYEAKETKPIEDTAENTAEVKPTIESKGETNGASQESKPIPEPVEQAPPTPTTKTLNGQEEEVIDVEALIKQDPKLKVFIDPIRDRAIKKLRNLKI